MNYTEFLESKSASFESCGFTPKALNTHLFDWQKLIVKWALQKGKSCLFADCGMGKTLMQLAWADQVFKKTKKPVLILAPLAVAQQTIAEGKRFGIKVNQHNDMGPIGITITNYEKLHKIDPSDYSGIVLDESSILKNYDGKYRQAITESFRNTPYKLACSATPSPNDHMELGTHAEFIGAMSRVEMLSTFFVHDGGDTSKWRLKGHAVDEFWKWLGEWCICISKPSDLGKFSDDGFILPELSMRYHFVSSPPAEDKLIAMPVTSLTERRNARRQSMDERLEVAKRLVNESDEQWLVWCNLNDEGTSLEKVLNGSVEVAGADTDAHKIKSCMDFASGEIRVLVTKSSIAGFGMNWQNCQNVLFFGLSDSYESFYQAIRRCYRFGQKQKVNCHVILSEAEQPVLDNINRKEKQSNKMREGMNTIMKNMMNTNVAATQNETEQYKEHFTIGTTYEARLADSVEFIKTMSSDSIDYTIFSPPFASLYTYSNSKRDMGNCGSRDEFYQHFDFLVGELLRVTKSGRLLSFHCANMQTSKTHDGFIGLHDFRGAMISAFQNAGWIYHSEVVIWKDPVVAMQRTKALGLLHKQLKKDACMSRQGIPDYLVTMRKSGVNPDPVTNTNESFPVHEWQNYASPIWMDINPSDTLQRESAREHNDERHICPLQLEVINRALRLWTKPDDLVFSPFMGIGSEGYCAITMDRRFIGIELKESYYKQAVLNLAAAYTKSGQMNLFEVSQ